jgi:hypothetical protein
MDDAPPAGARPPALPASRRAVVVLATAAGLLPAPAVAHVKWFAPYDVSARRRHSGRSWRHASS